MTYYFFDAASAPFRLYYHHLVGLIRLGFQWRWSMTFRNDETISCAECGRPFPFTYEQQRRARENHKRPPMYCRECHAILSNQRRSSQSDHPTRPVPDWAIPTSLPTAPTTPPEQQQERPLVEKRPSPPGPSRAAFNVLLVALVIAICIVAWLFIQALLG